MTLTVLETMLIQMMIMTVFQTLLKFLIRDHPRLMIGTIMVSLVKLQIQMEIMNIGQSQILMLQIQIMMGLMILKMVFHGTKKKQKIVMVIIGETIKILMMTMMGWKISEKTLLDQTLKILILMETAGQTGVMVQALQSLIQV